jgi:hypothetical protein
VRSAILGISEISEEERRGRYINEYNRGGNTEEIGKLVEIEPGDVDPYKHTMGHKVFLEYIGRPEVTDGPARFSVRSKKFSHQQIRQISWAYEHGLPVKIIGAFREDISFLLRKNCKHKIHKDELNFNDRKSKFNNRRPITLIVDQNLGSPEDARAGNDDDYIISGNGSVDRGQRPEQNKELWVVVFPSQQYVEQYAELILALFIDFHGRLNIGIPEEEFENKRKEILRSAKEKVRICHFKELLSSIGEWSNLAPFARLHIKAGDVIAIGNVDVFEEGLKSLQFQAVGDWQRGGLGSNKTKDDAPHNEGIFEIKVLCNLINGTRIVLLGVHECFWGDACSQYVSVLLDLGARHILYGSKAATLTSEDNVGKVISPSTFVTLTRGRGRNNSLPHANVLAEQVSFSNALNKLQEALDIKYTGIGMTVPTVIGEDRDEYKSYSDVRPTCMDCENGHIAGRVQKFNEIPPAFPNGLHLNVTRKSAFVPMHFVTDYIYEKERDPNSTTPHLALPSTDKDHLERKDRGYRKIGTYFGAYAGFFGVRQDVQPLAACNGSSYEEAQYIAEMKSVYDLVERGAGNAALDSLLVGNALIAISPARALAHAEVAQKVGHTSEALRSLNLAFKSTAGKNANLLLLRSSAVRIKILTQLGLFVHANEHLSSFDINKFSQISQDGAMHRRMALLQSVTCDVDVARKSIENAKLAHASAATSEYVHVTCELFGLLIEYTNTQKNNQPSCPTLPTKLSDLRKKFFEAPNKAKEFGLFNSEKGAVAALILDAASTLNSPYASVRRKAQIKLALAHMLKARIGGNETAETYGEILAVTADPYVRDLLVCALRRDYFGRQIFQRWCSLSNVDTHAIAVATLKILHAAPGSKEVEIQIGLD